MTELERARANLADAEASLAAGTNPYAQQNLDTARTRLASLEAAATPAPVAPPPSPANIATPTPIPAQPTGSREDRLRRLAYAWGAEEATLEAAIADGTTPDEFAMTVSEEALVKAAAREIANS